MNNMKRNKRLYCPAMTQSLSTISSEFEKVSHTIPLKKRKINHTKVEEIRTINTQCSSKILNISKIDCEDKENSDNSSNLNFSFVNSSLNNISSTVSNLARDLNKIKIHPKENLKSQDDYYKSKNSNKAYSKISNEDKNFSKANTFKRNFSLSNLNTQTRSNFKNIFHEIIKIQKDLNSNLNKSSSLSCSHSNLNFIKKDLNSNFKNSQISKNKLNLFTLKNKKTPNEKVNKNNLTHRHLKMI